MVFCASVDINPYWRPDAHTVCNQYFGDRDELIRNLMRHLGRSNAKPVSLCGTLETTLAGDAMGLEPEMVYDAEGVDNVIPKLDTIIKYLESGNYCISNLTVRLERDGTGTSEIYQYDNFPNLR